MKPILLALVLALISGMATVVADELPNLRADLEAKLHGPWQGGLCRGLLLIAKGGTFERRHYSPVNNELAGTWRVDWGQLPPTLVLTCQSSDDPERYPVDRTWELKVIRLDAENLVYEYPDQTRVEYRRITDREEAADRLHDVVVQGTMTQVIGNFRSHGPPGIGDTFELDLGNLPKETWKLGGPAAKRLTVAQYRNTLRELLLLDDELTETLPPDAVSKDGFATTRRRWLSRRFSSNLVSRSPRRLSTAPWSMSQQCRRSRSSASISAARSTRPPAPTS